MLSLSFLNTNSYSDERICENNLIDQVNYLIITAHFSDHLDIHSINKFSKNTRENFSPIDTLYPQDNLQTNNENQMLNNFNNPNTQNKIYKNTDDPNVNCENIFNNNIIQGTNNYILVKEIDNEYYLLNGYIYDINNSEVYLDKLNERNLKNHQNYGLKLYSAKVDQDSFGFNIKVQPYNSKFNSNIPGFIQGENNGTLKINPLEGNLNNIFYFKNCGSEINAEDSLDDKLSLLNKNNIHFKPTL